MPFQLPEIYAAVEECDIFMTIGTSGHVYPAAGLIDVAKQSGALCVGVNLDEPMNYELHDEFHQGKAGELLPDLIANAIK
jgi:NAD-dependent deacetylase